ncbi:MAG: DUF3592 domain-containing protein [Firmicutes bacterium]|nr:DUF3592 domain-containing protein [Bacillota bacterium]
MEISRGLNRVVAKFLPLLFVIGGIVVIIMSISGLHDQDTFTSAKGVIRDIQVYEDRDADGDLTYTYDVTVDFEADGKSYTSVMGDYEDSYEVGKEIDIVFDPEDPTNIAAAGKSKYFIMIAAGVVVIIIGAIGFLRGLSR